MRRGTIATRGPEALPITLVNDKGEGVAELVPNPAIHGGVYGPVTAKEDKQKARPANRADRGQSAGKTTKPRRMRTVVGGSMQANNVTIVLSIASLMLLIDEKLASLREERPNHPDAQASREDAIAEYQRIRRELESLRDVAIEVRRDRADEKTATKAASTFMDGIRKTWEKTHEEICTKVLDATLFVSSVSLCSLVGCGGTAAVAVSGALVGGKPVIEPLRTLPKRLFK